MASRHSVATFLSCARNALNAPPSSRLSPLTFVIGNESADLDSLCSVLLAAYLRSYPPSNENINIPIAHIPRRDLALRPELSAVLQEAGVSHADVLTVDDIPDSVSSRDARWVLVDHNAPVGILGAQSPLKRLTESAPKVVGIIDHHDDEGVVQPGPEVEPRIIRKCGSCSSLVTEYFRDIWDRLSSADDGGEEAAKQLAHIALGPILIDTTNLLSVPKTTQTDIWAVEYVESKLKSDRALTRSASSSSVATSRTDYSREKFFDKLSSLKEDLSSMSYHDILRKDYKSWTEESLSLGISTAPQPFSYLLSKPRVQAEEDFVSEFGKWAAEQKLDLAALMTTGKSPEGSFQRELVIWARNEPGVRAMDKFVKMHRETLRLREYENENGEELDMEKTNEWRVFWRQGEVRESRKQVAPKLREVMREVARLCN